MLKAIPTIMLALTVAFCLMGPGINSHVFHPADNSRIKLVHNIQPLGNVQLSFFTHRNEGEFKIHQPLSQLRSMMSQSTSDSSSVLFSDIAAFDTRTTQFTINPQADGSFANQNTFSPSANHPILTKAQQRPFGDAMIVSLGNLLQGARSRGQADDDSDDETASPRPLDLILEVDEDVIGAPEGELPYADGFGYLAQTNYHGKFYTRDGEEAVVIVSLTPIGNAHAERLAKIQVEKNKQARGNNLETQAMDSLSELVARINSVISTSDAVVGIPKAQSVAILAQFLDSKSKTTSAQQSAQFAPLDINTSKMSLLSMLETDLDTLDVTESSGRYENGFTIDAMITTPSGSYYISPASTLLYQLESKFDSAQHLHTQTMDRFIVTSLNLIESMAVEQSALQAQPVGELSIEDHPLISEKLEIELTQAQKMLLFATAEMESLSRQHQTLAAAQQTASYDLVSYTIDSPFRWDPASGGPQPCGSIHLDGDDSHHDGPADVVVDEATSPYDMSTQWTLARMACTHARKDLTVHVFIRGYAALSFSAWASGSSVVNSNMVIARVKYFFHATSKTWSPQWGIVPVLQSLVVMTSLSNDGWNPTSPSDARCSDSSDTQGAKAEAMIVALAAVRQNTASEQVGAQHFLFATCNDSGVVGINYVNIACSIRDSAGYGSFTSQNPMVLSHELGHGVLGLPHPFGRNAALQGAYGGTMDYFRTRLPEDVDGARMNGFNSKTDQTTACGVLNTIYTRSAAQTGFVAPSRCFTTPGVTANTCGNGIIDSFEQCDEETECCQDCKLVSGATCNGTNKQCCAGCQSLPYTTRCDINWKNDGICSNGECLPLLCPTSTPGSAGVVAPAHSCPATSYFPTAATDLCEWRCPAASANPAGSTTAQAGCNALTSGSSYLAQIGARCGPNGAGICMPAKPFQTEDYNSPYFCQTTGVDVFTWDLALIQKCDCNAGKGNVYSYTCRNIAGDIVADSFCGAITKPGLPACNCQITYQWKYGDWGTSCGPTECNSGAITRTATCQQCTSAGTCSDLLTTTACTQALFVPLTLRQCAYTPTEDKKCAMGNALGFSCGLNPQFNSQPTIPGTSTEPYMVCNCQNGWSGDLCRLEPKVSDLVVAQPSGDEDTTLADNTFYLNQQVTLTWTYSGTASNSVSITYYPTASTTSTAQKVVIATGVLATDETYTASIPAGLPANSDMSARFRVAIAGSTLFADSDSFAVLSFRWGTKLVSACEGQCGTSIQKQDIICNRSDDQVVSNDKCGHIPNPPAEVTVCTHAENMSCSSDSAGSYCVDNQCSATPLQYVFSSPSDTPSTTPATSCQLGAFNFPDCQCRVAYLTLDFTYAPSLLFPDRSLAASARLTDEGDLRKSLLTPERRIDMMAYLDIIRAHFARISGLPITRLFVANWVRVEQPQNKNVISVRLTVGFRAFCNGVDVAEPAPAGAVIAQATTTTTAAAIPQQLFRFQHMDMLQKRDTDQTATPLDEVYAGMQAVVDAMLANDLLIRADVQRVNGPSTGIIISQESANNNPIYDPLCKPDQLSQYSGCFSTAANPFTVSTSETGNPNGASTPLKLTFFAVIAMMGFVLMV